MRRADIDNSQDILDSRDIIKRLEELEELRADLIETAKENRARVAELEALEERMIDEANELATLTEEFWTATDGAELYYSLDYGEDEENEYKALRALVDQCEGYGDWVHGEALIRESYFKDYAIQTAEDIHGEAVRNASWPFDCIDWDEAARALEQDYSSVEFDGVTYLMRG